jgi:tetratricopeptide (TPR) repeat protein
MCEDRTRERLSFAKLHEGLRCALSEAPVQRQLFLYALLAVCTLVLLVHLPDLSARANLYDDQYYVINNPLVQNASWASAWRFLVEVRKPSTVPGYYHPLTMISLMVDRFLAGPRESIRVYHRTSLLLHVANTALLAVFLYLLLGQPLISAGVALLFGLHPIAVESVCWLSERKTVLSSFFALWSLIAYVRFARDHKMRFYATCVVTYMLALLSKPIALPLPFVMLLLDHWPLGGLRWRSVAEKVPLFGVAGTFTVIGYVSQLHSGSIRLPGQYDPLQVPLLLSHNMIFYVCKLFWPVHMSPHYESVDSIDPSNPQMIVSIVIACALVFLLLLSLRWTPAVAIGSLAALALILPASGIVSHAVAPVANRYLYLPSIGLLLALAWLLTRLSAGSREFGLLWRPFGVFLVVFLLAGAEATATRRYLHHWSSTRNLYEYALSMFPRSATLHNDLAVSLKLQGRREEAAEHFRAAIRGDPTFYRAHYNLAIVLDELGCGTRQVIRHYQRALQLAPWFVDARLNLGSVLFRTGHQCEGLASVQKAIEAAPRSAPLHYDYGTMLVAAQQAEAGLSHLRKAIEIDPHFVTAIKGLVWFLATHPDERIRDPNEAVRLAENMRAMTKDADVSVLDVAAAAYATAGQWDRAVAAARQALAIAARREKHEAVEQIRERLRLYEAGCPYREAPQVRLDRTRAALREQNGQKEDSKESQDVVEAVSTE